MSHLDMCLKAVKQIQTEINDPVTGPEKLDRYCRELGYTTGDGSKVDWLLRRLGDDLFAAVCLDDDQRQRLIEWQGLCDKWVTGQFRKLRRANMERRMNRLRSNY